MCPSMKSTSSKWRRTNQSTGWLDDCTNHRKYFSATSSFVYSVLEKNSSRSGRSFSVLHSSLSGWTVRLQLPNRQNGKSQLKLWCSCPVHSLRSDLSSSMSAKLIEVFICSIFSGGILYWFGSLEYLFKFARLFAYNWPDSSKKLESYYDIISDTSYSSICWPRYIWGSIDTHRPIVTVVCFCTSFDWIGSISFACISCSWSLQ